MMVKNLLDNGIMIRIQFKVFLLINLELLFKNEI